MEDIEINKKLAQTMQKIVDEWMDIFKKFGEAPNENEPINDQQF